MSDEILLAAIARDVREIRAAIHGNGKPGLKLRLDRVERVQKVVVWSAGLLGSGTLLAAGAWVWGKFIT